MVRAAFAVALSVALQAGALTAPLTHAHLQDHDDGHHRGRQVHAHLPGHSHYHESDHDADDDRRISGAATPEQVSALPLFVAVDPGASIDFAAPPASFFVAPPLASVMRQAPDEVRSHGPPAHRPASLRAPPISLS